MDDVFGAHIIAKVERSILLITLPYKTIVTANTFQTLPDNLRWRFKTNIYANDWLSNSSSPMIELNQSTPQLACKKITVSFVPATQADTDYINSQIPAPHADGTPITASELPQSLPGYLLNLKPEIRVNGVPVGRGSTVGMGSNLMQHNAIYDPGRQAWAGGSDNSLIAGEYGAMVVDLQGVVQAQINSQTAKLQSLKNKFDLVRNNPSDRTPIAGLTTDDSIGDILFAGMLAYFFKVDKSDRAGAQALGNVATYRLPSYGRNFVAASPHLFFGVVRSISFKSMAMDVGWLVTQAESRTANASEKRGFVRQAGAAWSAAEHQIPEALLVDRGWLPDDPARPQAISAVKAIAIAAQQGQKIYTFGPGNPSMHPTVYSLQMSEDARAEIVNALASGKEVTVHERAITLSGWTGSGYIITDLTTGVGAYKISGGTNGSSISVPCSIILMLLASFQIWLVTELVSLIISGAETVTKDAFDATVTAVINAFTAAAGTGSINFGDVTGVLGSAMFALSNVELADLTPQGEVCQLAAAMDGSGEDTSCSYACPSGLAFVGAAAPDFGNCGRMKCRPVAKAPPKCNECQKLDTSGAWPVCIIDPAKASPALKLPAPSDGPSPEYSFSVSGPNDPWGRNYGIDYNPDVTCKELCVGGNKRFGIDGDITPSPDWKIIVFMKFQAPNCPVAYRTAENISRTSIHEMKHRGFFLSLINGAKAKIGQLYASAATCSGAKTELTTKLAADWAAMIPRQMNHTVDFVGEFQYASDCQNGVSVEVRSIPF